MPDARTSGRLGLKKLEGLCLYDTDNGLTELKMGRCETLKGGFQAVFALRLRKSNLHLPKCQGAKFNDSTWWNGFASPPVHNVTIALPHVKPPPKATSRTVSPFLALPVSSASSSAMGTDAADVLP